MISAFFKRTQTTIIMLILINKNDIYFLQSKTNQSFWCKYLYAQFYISFKIILNKRFLVFKIHELYCHELIFCKPLNLQKPRQQYEKLIWKLQVRTKNFFGAEQIFWNRDTSINTSCASYKRRALQGEILISIENLTHRCTQTGEFFPKLGYFLSIWKDNRGGLPPSPLLVARLN